MSNKLPYKINGQEGEYTLHDGDIVLVHAKGLNVISASIRILTKSYWNHVGVYFRSYPWAEEQVVEALGTVIVNDFSKYLDYSNFDVKVVRINAKYFKDEYEREQKINTFLQNMYSLVGKRYDGVAIVWLGIKCITKNILRPLWKLMCKTNNWLDSKERFFCSEAVCASAEGLSTVKPCLFQGENDKQAYCNNVTPKDIGKADSVDFVWSNISNGKELL
jgi:hypothetical protein